MSVDAVPEVPAEKRGISRREFLRLTGGTLAAIAGYYLLLHKYDELLSGLFGDNYSESAEYAKSYLKIEYGLDVLNGSPKNDSAITGTDLSKREFSRGLGVIMEEVIKYPQNFFRENGVSAIRFLNDIRIKGKGPFDGHYDLKGTIYTGYKAQFSHPFGEKREQFRGVFHHEAFHGADYKDGGYTKDDRQWRDLHNCGCQPYQEIGGRDSLEGVAPSPIGWFLNNHGQKNPMEDRAEFGRFMMISGLHRELIQRIRDEEDVETQRILELKYRLTAEYYKKWSRGLMDEKYWEDLMGDKIKFGYFPSHLKGE